MPPSPLILGLSLLFAGPAPVFTDESWRSLGGPDGQFRASGSALAAWEGEAPRVLWRQPLGSGHSGVSVGGGLAITHYRPLDEDGKATDRSVVVAFDATSGTPRWKKTRRCLPLDGQETYGSGGPHATPCVHDDAVFALDFDGVLRALELEDGRPRWSLDLVEEWRAPPVQFGFGASPVVVDGAVVVTAGGPGGAVRALDPATGSVFWASEPFEVAYVTPLDVECEGRRSLVVVAQDRILGLDPADGRTQWSLEHRKAGLTNYAQPVWIDGRYLAVGGQGSQGLRLLELRAGDEGWTVEERWHQRSLQLSHGIVQRRGDLLLLGSGASLTAVRWSDGRRLWRERGFVECGLVDAGDRLLALCEDGRLELIDAAADRLERYASAPLLAEPAWTPPSVVDGIVYLRDRRELLALDLRRRGPARPPRETRPQRVLGAAEASSVPEAYLEFFQGRYSTEAGETLHVQREGGSLRIEDAEGSRPLVARGDTRFEDSSGTRYDFFFDDEGAVEGLERRSAGATTATPLRRLPEEEVEGGGRPPARWTGRYTVEDGSTLEVRVEGARLHARSTALGSVDLRLLRTGEGRYVVQPLDPPFGIPPVIVRFVEREGGVELRVYRGGETILGTRNGEN